MARLENFIFIVSLLAPALAYPLSVFERQIAARSVKLIHCCDGVVNASDLEAVKLIADLGIVPIDPNTGVAVQCSGTPVLPGFCAKLVSCIENSHAPLSIECEQLLKPSFP
ncbi:hypothetical protein B0H13DRAFT_1878216 [Mycena leptocephala]|nr:hypothetical protein B0H13DRAFT_1878216 [Mycena leptocephala]